MRLAAWPIGPPSGRGRRPGGCGRRPRSACPPGGRRWLPPPGRRPAPGRPPSPPAGPPPAAGRPGRGRRQSPPARTCPGSGPRGRRRGWPGRWPGDRRRGPRRRSGRPGAPAARPPRPAAGPPPGPRRWGRWCRRSRGRWPPRRPAQPASDPLGRRRPGAHRRPPAAAEPLGPGGQLGPGLADGHRRQPVLVAVDERRHLPRARPQPAAQHPRAGLGQGRLAVAGQAEQQLGPPGHSAAGSSARASRVQATRAIRRVQGWRSPAMDRNSGKRAAGSRATSGPSTFMPSWSVVSQLSSRAVQVQPTRAGSVAARAARSPASRKQATSCSSRIPVRQSRSASAATWAAVASRWPRSQRRRWPAGRPRGPRRRAGWS